MSNFDQTIVTLPKKEGGDLKTNLRSDWDQLGDGERVITNVQARQALRTMGIRGNPDRIIRISQERHPEAYAIVMSYLHTSEQHVEKFAEQARVHKQDLANRKLLAKLASFLNVGEDN